jgi:hypothetical protein
MRDAQDIIFEFAMHADDGPRFIWRRGNCAWSERDRCIFNRSKWKYAFNGRVLDQLAGVIDHDEPGWAKNPRDMARKWWLLLSVPIFFKVLKSLPEEPCNR